MQVALLRQEAGHRFWFTSAQVKRVSEAFLAGPHKVCVRLQGLLQCREGRPHKMCVYVRVAARSLAMHGRQTSCMHLAHLRLQLSNKGEGKWPV